MREIDNNIVKVRRLVAHFHRSPKATACLKEKQQILKIPLHKLIVDVSTRWNSIYEMIARFSQQYAAIHLALTELRQIQLLKLLNTKNLVGNLQDIEKV